MFASRVRNLRESGIREIFNRACNMTDCINLSIGQADFEVPPVLRQAATDAIEGDFNCYCVTGGLPQLKQGILHQLRAERGVQAESVLVTSGVTGGLALAFLCLVEPGDEVLIPDPYFVPYRTMVDLCKGIPVFYDTYPDFRLRRTELESKISDKTKLILVNSPGNPTGICYSPHELRMIAEVAAKRNLLVVSDEIYWRFAYDSPSHSMLEFYPNTLLLSGFSKSFAVPGWRIGYAAGPESILETMETLQQYTYVCAPTPLQKACTAGLDCDISRHVKEYRARRDRIYDGLRQNFEVVKPDGAFYMFIKVPWPEKTATEFVQTMLEHGLLLVPGKAFSTRDTHFRLSFAVPPAELEAGIKLLNEMAVAFA